MPRNVGVRGNTPVVPTLPANPVAGDQVTMAGSRATYEYDGSAWNASLTSNSASIAGANLVDDSSMELGTITQGDYNTTHSYDTTQFRTGARSVKYVMTDTFGVANLGLIAISVGKTYTGSIYVRSSSNQTVSAQVRFYTEQYGILDSTTGVTDVTSITSGWTRISHTRVAPATAYYATLMVNVVGPVGTAFYFDDVQIEEGSTATPYSQKASEITTTTTNKVVKFADSTGRVATDSGFPAALATTSTPGFMAAADKTKLDGLGTPITTTGDQTGLTGNKTSNGSWTVGSLNVSGGQAVGAHGVGLQDNGNRAYSDSNPPDSLMQTVTPVGSPPANPASGYGTQYVSDDGMFRAKNSAGVVSIMVPQTEWDKRPRTTQVGNTVNLSGSTAEQLIMSMFIPNGLMSSGSHIRISAFGTSTQSAAAANLTFRVRAGANATAAATGPIGAVNALNTPATARTSAAIAVDGMVKFLNVGASGSYLGQLIPAGNVFAGGAATVPTGVTAAQSIDTSAGIYLVLTCQASVTTITSAWTAITMTIYP